MNAKENASLGVLLSVSGKAARSIVVAIMLFLPGCAAMQNAGVSNVETPFYLAYDSQEVIRDQSKVATIISHTVAGVEAQETKIDGVAVTPEDMRSAANRPGSLMGTVLVDVLPGEHQVQLILIDRSMPPPPVPLIPKTQHFQVQLIGRSMPSAPLIPKTQHFEAGRIYNANPITLWTHVEENTSTEVAQKIAENRNSAVFENKK